METWLQLALTSFATLGASSGFWAYIQSKDRAKSATNQLLMGIVYEKILSLGGEFIERGWLYRDEYEDYRKYFYEPYTALGGNGVAERIMSEVSGLRIRPHARYADVIRMHHPNEESVNHVRIVSRNDQDAASE